MSKKTLKLDEPVLIDGKEVSELTYDPMEITAAQFSEACARSSAINKSKSFSFKMRENDYALHLYLGMFAVTSGSGSSMRASPDTSGSTPPTHPSTTSA